MNQTKAPPPSTLPETFEPVFPGVPFSAGSGRRTRTHHMGLPWDQHRHSWTEHFVALNTPFPKITSVFRWSGIRFVAGFTSAFILHLIPIAFLWTVFGLIALGWVALHGVMVGIFLEEGQAKQMVALAGALPLVGFGLYFIVVWLLV